MLTRLQNENDKLRGTLKVKKTGNVMLNALMRGFRMKLEEALTESRQAMAEKTAEVQQFSRVVQQQNV